jgi:galactonate dehydratase
LEFGFSQPDYIICETVGNDVPWRDEVVQDHHARSETTRTVTASLKPGLGVDIDETAIQRHPFQQELPQREFLADGSVGDW